MQDHPTPKTPLPLTITIQPDPAEDAGRWDLAATADHRVLARAWVQHNPGTGLYNTTVRNHPSNWRGNLELTFENQDEAIAAAKQGLVDIVGQPTPPPGTGPATPPATTCFFAKTTDGVEMELSLDPYTKYWESWKRPSTQPRRVATHPDRATCLRMTEELTGPLSGWKPHNPVEETSA